MKTKKLFYACIALSIMFFSCDGGDDSIEGYETPIEKTSEMSSSDSGEPGGMSGRQNEKRSGLLTAGEWNDLENWRYWTKLLNDNNYYEMPNQWQFYPKNLVAVRLIDADSNAVPNVPVTLLNGGNTEFSTKTDNSGYAYCWINLFSNSKIEENKYSLKIGSMVVDSVLLTTKADSVLNFNNIMTTETMHTSNTADVAFIVDATGSMSDEIDFLKADLSDIITQANSLTGVELRTGALFYRDEGDDYLTRSDNFSSDVSKTQQFVAAQQASGGGDYPEAVHSALVAALQDLSWNESARARIAFLILDAPAHHNDNVIRSLQISVEQYAQGGIKIIPVAASGADKETEFMLRFFETATGGTYVFLTDDSGIGNPHIEASVGDYNVEPLADIMVRLIEKYVK